VIVARRRRASSADRARAGVTIGLRLVGIGLLAFLLGYSVASIAFFRGAARERFVAVPDLRRLDETRARALVEEADLEFQVANRLPHPEAAPGAVLAQTPLPGQEVQPGTVVRIILSSGRERVPIPEVAHLGAEQARNLLERMGFTVTVREVPHESGAGRLVEVLPPPGTGADIPSQVELVVSAGPPLLEVPQVTGLTADQAEGILSASGFRLGGVHFDPFGGGPPGRIYDQHPVHGDSARVGSRVDVWIVGFGQPPAEPDLD
jgi:eukaryotic-like serine/threonine-protein kinase